MSTYHTHTRAQRHARVLLHFYRGILSLLSLSFDDFLISFRFFDTATEITASIPANAYNHCYENVTFFSRCSFQAYIRDLLMHDSS